MWNLPLTWATLGPHREMTWTFYFVEMQLQVLFWLTSCGTRECYGGHFGRPSVGRENVKGDNMFVLHIKICDIVVLGVFKAILCGGRL